MAPRGGHWRAVATIAARLAAQHEGDQRHHLRREQQHAGEAEQRQHQPEVGGRPDRKELVGLEEVRRLPARMLGEEQRREHQEGEPER